MSGGQDWPALTRESTETWERMAAFWDERMGDDGNDFTRILVAPAAERLLAMKPGERLLDVACGNGTFARRMARHGVSVVACDASAAFLDRSCWRWARGRSMQRSPTWR